MKKRKLRLLLAAVVLIAAFFGVKWFRDIHIFVEGKAYPKDAVSLDLRGRDITAAHYEAVREAFPGCEIQWDVPFQGAAWPEDTRTLSITALTEEDAAALDYFPQLETVDARGCTAYALLADLRERRPEVEVLYAVTIDDAEEITLSAVTEEEIELLGFLPNLRKVDAETSTDYAYLAAIQKQYPQCQVRYFVPVSGEQVAGNAVSLTLTGADTEALLEKLAYLPRLEQVELLNPVGSAGELLALTETYPQIAFLWEMDVLGVRVSSEDTEVDLSGIALEHLDAVEEAMAYFPKAEKVLLCDCGIDNETLAAFREKMREEYKVVWSVQIGVLTVRTDETTFMPNQHGLGEEWAYDLRYCEDMICVDVGHKPILTCTWAAYMPNLRYLILADTSVRDLSPLSGLKNLVYLELFLAPVKDYTPLLGCTALEDLNISNTFGDPEPLLQMTWLKRLWWAGVGTRASYDEFREALPDTELMFAADPAMGYGWRQGYLYFEMRDALGMYYMWG